jgi:hypothetical protein
MNTIFLSLGFVLLNIIANAQKNERFFDCLNTEENQVF